MIQKGDISHILRKLRLIWFTDFLRYHIQKIKNWRANKHFRKTHPEVVLPPDYLIYESFQLHYKKYYTESRETAQWLIGHFEKHIELAQKNILDWGCGPGRLIRHLPALIGHGCSYYGTDYNRASIEWCRTHIPDVQFNLNQLEAKLPYPDEFFDVIYGISIYTHLSEKMHHEWHRELSRILKPNGIMLMTTQGDPFRVKLTEPESVRYQQGKLIVRGQVKEGHRTYSAFHPTSFMEQLFSNMKIEEHIVGQPEKGKWLPQDIWIIRKNK